MSTKRTLSTLPGWAEAAQELLGDSRSTLHKGHLRSVGAWVPPRSLKRVTTALVHALALGLVRQETQLAAERMLEQERERAVIPIWRARLWRDRASGKFSGHWSMSPTAGGDPTL